MMGRFYKLTDEGFVEVSAAEAVKPEYRPASLQPATLPNDDIQWDSSAEVHPPQSSPVDPSEWD